MKIFLLALLFPVAVYAKGVQITASGGSPVPIAFSTSNAQSQVMECSGNVAEILNQSTSVLAYGFGRSTSVPPFDYAFVPPGANSGTRVKPKGGLGSGTYLYIRAATTAITSGTVQVSCFTEERP